MVVPFLERFCGSRARIGTVNRSCRRKEADIGVNTGNPPRYVGGYESTVHQKQHLCVLFVKVCIGGYQPAGFCHCKFDGCRLAGHLTFWEVAARLRGGSLGLEPTELWRGKGARRGATLEPKSQ